MASPIYTIGLLKKNGSPRATIETNEERTFINVSIPVHSGCGDTVIFNNPQGVPQGIGFDQWIEEQIRQNPKITTAMSGSTSVTIRSLPPQVGKLRMITLH